MNKFDIRKRIDLSITIMIAFFFAIGLSFSILDFRHSYENYIMFLIVMIITVVSYYTNVTLALILTLITDFSFISIKLYYYLTSGIAVEKNTYYWLVVVILSAVISSLISKYLGELQGDIKELTYNNEKLIMIDPETGLRNLKAFMNEMPIYMSMVKRHRELPLTLMVTKIRYSNNIKKILGHEEYINMLSKLTKLTKDALRDEDRKYIINDDTFVYILITNKDGSDVVKERIKNILKEVELDEDNILGNVKLEIQSGSYMWNEDIKDTIDFLKRAEAEMEYDV